MSKWSSLYENEILSATSINEFINNKLKTKKKLIKLILKYSKDDKILEFGAGTGVLALYLSTIYKNGVDALDKDNDIIDLSKKYIVPYFKNHNLNYIHGELNTIKRQNKYDVCYSIGVLEHYNDNQIIDLITQQIMISRYVIICIPTRYFDKNKRMYGDERYLTLRYWRKLIKNSNCDIVKESSYHYLNYPKRIFNLKKLFKPNPVHIFVLKSNLIK